MGTRRYSRDPTVRRRQERVDDLQRRCGWWSGSPTIGELTGAGVRHAELRCKCGHCGETPLDLSHFGPGLSVWQLRGNYYCSVCGISRPMLRLRWEK